MASNTKKTPAKKTPAKKTAPERKRSAAKKTPEVNRTVTTTSQQTESYQPTRLALEHEGFDHHAAEAQRQAELDAQRDEHNRRTGGGRRDTTKEPDPEVSAV